jgi:hypothetical protein
MKPHFTKISRWDARENGSRVYAVWLYLASDNASVKGFITKTPWGTRKIDLEHQCGHHETRLLSEAKRIAKELLD